MWNASTWCHYRLFPYRVVWCHKHDKILSQNLAQHGVWFSPSEWGCILCLALWNLMTPGGPKWHHITLSALGKVMVWFHVWFTVETLYSTIYHSKYFIVFTICCHLNSQKTLHTSPFRASYGVSFMSTSTEIDRVIKSFYCTMMESSL